MQFNQYNAFYTGQDINLELGSKHKISIGVSAAGYSVKPEGGENLVYKTRRGLMNDWQIINAGNELKAPEATVIPTLPKAAEIVTLIGDDVETTNEIESIVYGGTRCGKSYSASLFPKVVFKNAGEIRTADLIAETATISKQELADALLTAAGIDLTKAELIVRLFDQFLKDSI